MLIYIDELKSRKGGWGLKALMFVTEMAAVAEKGGAMFCHKNQVFSKIY